MIYRSVDIFGIVYRILFGVFLSIVVQIFLIQLFASDVQTPPEDNFEIIYQNISYFNNFEIKYNSTKQKFKVFNSKNNYNKTFEIKTIQDINKITQELLKFIKEKEELLQISDILSNYLYQQSDCCMLNFVLPTSGTKFDSFNNETREILSRIKKDHQSTGILQMRFNGNILELRLETDNNGVISRFSVVGLDETSEDYTVIEKNNSIIIKDKNGEIVFILGTGDDFKKDSGGIISLSTISDSGKLKKRLYNLTRKNKNWKMTVRSSNLGVIDLSSDSNPNLNFLVLEQVFGFIPIKLVGGFIDSTLATIYVNLKNPKKLVRQKIIDGARNACIFNEKNPENGLISKSVVEEIAKKISEEHSVKFQPLKKSFNINKVASLSIVEAIAQHQLAKLNEMSVDSGVVIEASKRVVKDLKTCFNNSVKQKHLDQCIKHFSASAHYRIGLEVLRIQLPQNLGEMTQDIRLTESKAQAAYNECMTERFFVIQPGTKKTGKREGREETEEDKQTREIVQSCVFSGFLAGTDNVINEQLFENIVSLQVAGNDTDNTEIEKQIKSLKEYFYSCLGQNSIVSRTGGYYEYNHKTLAVMEPDMFRDTLMVCVDELTKNAGRDLTSITIKKDPRIMSLFEDVNGEIDRDKLDSFTNNVLKEGYDPCIKAQKELKPEACRFFIEQTGMRFGAMVSLKNELDDANVSGRDASKVFVNLKNCTKKLDDSILSSVVAEEVTVNEENLYLENSLNCIKNSISDSSEYISQSTLSDMVSSDQRLRDMNISVTPRMKEILGKSVKNCFSREITPVKSIDKLTDDEFLEKLKEKCTLVGEKVITPIIVVAGTNSTINQFIKEGSVSDAKAKEVLQLYAKDLDKRRNLGAQNPYDLEEVLTLVIGPVIESRDERKLDRFIDEYVIGLGEYIAPHIVDHEIRLLVSDMGNMDEKKIQQIIDKTGTVTKACLRMFVDDEKNHYDVGQDIWKNLTDIRKARSDYSTETWQSACEDFTTIFAGRDIVRLYMESYENIDGILPKEETVRNRIIEDILKNSYDPCVQTLKEKYPDVPVDPDKCRGKIIAEATAVLMQEKISRELLDSFPVINIDQRSKFMLTEEQLKDNAETNKKLMQKIFSGDHSIKKLKERILTLYAPYEKASTDAEKAEILKKADHEFDNIVSNFTKKSVLIVGEKLLDEESREYFYHECSLTGDERTKALAKIKKEKGQREYYKRVFNCKHRDKILTRLLDGDNVDDPGLKLCLKNTDDYDYCAKKISLKATSQIAPYAIASFIKKLDFSSEHKNDMTARLTGEFKTCINDIENNLEHLNQDVVDKRLNECKIKIANFGLEKLLPILSSLEENVPLADKLPSRFLEPVNRIISKNLANNIKVCTKTISREEDFEVYLTLFNGCISHGMTSSSIDAMETIGTKMKIIKKITEKIKKQIIKTEESFIKEVFKKNQLTPPDVPYGKNRSPEVFLKAVSYSPDVNMDHEWVKDNVLRDLNETVVTPVLDYVDDFDEILRNHPYAWVGM